MTDLEIAIERLSGWIHRNQLSNKAKTFIGDVALVVMAAKSTIDPANRSDDNDKTTSDWLQTIGCTWANNPAGGFGMWQIPFGDGRCKLSFAILHDRCRWGFDMDITCGGYADTRGEVRKLCQALGATIKG